MILNHKLIPAASARNDYLGNPSDMSLWRWLHSPEMGFPKPIYINRRRYWREEDLIAWVQSRSQEHAA